MSQPQQQPRTMDAKFRTAVRRRWGVAAVVGATVLIIFLIILLTGCSGTTSSSTPLATVPNQATTANAPTISACRTLATDTDIFKIRKGMSGQGEAEVSSFAVDRALNTIYALREPGADVNVDPSVADAMRAASEQAKVIRDKDDHVRNFDRAAWTNMLTSVDMACKLAGVDMTLPGSP